jgi:hypothetical protein
MFKLITTMQRGSATGLPAAWAHYPTVEAARLAATTLLRDDRILRVMIVRDEIPLPFGEGGTPMNSRHSSQAEHTVAILQQAAHGGLPVLIPGAFEVRVGRPIARGTVVVAESAASRSPAAEGSDRAGLEREREGGGAPSQRRGRRQRTLLGNLWHGVLHPSDVSVIWRHPLPQQR